MRARFALAKAPHYTVLPMERQGSQRAAKHGNSPAVHAILRRRDVVPRILSSSTHGGGVINVLDTGTDGYLGSLLAPVLIKQGFDVTGVDTGYYRAGWRSKPPGIRAEELHQDVHARLAHDLGAI